MQKAAAAMLLQEDTPAVRRMVRESLLTPGLLPETQQTFLLWLAEHGEQAPVNVLIGQRIASATCTRDMQRCSSWRMFLPQLVQNAAAGTPKSGLLAFAVALWPRMTRAQRQQAAGQGGYAWAKAIEILYLRQAGRENQAARVAGELLISVRKICRILRAIVRQTEVAAHLPLKGEET